MRCPFCPKEYESYKKLKKHMVKIHDGSMSKSDVEKWNNTIKVKTTWRNEK